MNLSFLKIESITEMFGKFQLSWFTSLTLTAFSPVADAFLPIVTQIVLLFAVQLIAFGSDFARSKWLSERRKTTIKQVKDEIYLETELNQEIKKDETENIL